MTAGRPPNVTRAGATLPTYEEAVASPASSPKTASSTCGCTAELDKISRMLRHQSAVLRILASGRTTVPTVWGTPTHPYWTWYTTGYTPSMEQVHVGTAEFPMEPVGHVSPEPPVDLNRHLYDGISCYSAFLQASIAYNQSYSGIQPAKRTMPIRDLIAVDSN